MAKDNICSQINALINELANDNDNLRQRLNETQAQLDKANEQLQEGNIPNVNSTVKNCEETASELKSKNKNIKDEFLKCQQCGEYEETFAAITYSQGTRVCRKCKNNNETSDKAAYDRYINTKHSSGNDENND